MEKFVFIPLLVNEFFFNILNDQFSDDEDFLTYITEIFKVHENKYTIGKFNSDNSITIIVRDYQFFDKYTSAKLICNYNNN